MKITKSGLYKIEYLVLQKTLLTGILILLGFFMVMPYIWMISASMKKPLDIFQIPIKWIPAYFYPDNYNSIFGSEFKFYIFFLNSIKITVINVFTSVLTSTMAGFAFAKIRFRFKEAIFILLLSTMMVPEQLIIIPRFVIFKAIGVTNTHYALLLIGIFTPTGSFLMRQFFSGIPTSLVESAFIDGASRFRIFLSIMIPNVKPALISLICITSIWWWNDYLNAYIFLADKNLYTIPVALDFFKGEKGLDGAQIGSIMAATSVATLPLILVYLFGQRYIIQGVVTSGVKG